MNDNKVLAIFRRLARRNSCLARIASGRMEDRSSESYGVIVEGNRAEKIPAISKEDVRRWLSGDLIEPCENGFRLSAAGRSWLKRRLASTDEFQGQHQDRQMRVIDFEGVRRRALMNDGESPLRWLASRKDKNGAPLLASFQIEAGERLRADYQFAGLTARVTASWSPTANCHASGGAPNDAAALQDHVLAARQRVVRALAAVGPELSGILVDVCCHLKGLEEAEKTEGWPQRSGKVILQFALTRLARHYGLISDNSLNTGLKRKLMHWGAEDFRPKIHGDEAAS